MMIIFRDALSHYPHFRGDPRRLNWELAAHSAIMNERNIAEPDQPPLQTARTHYANGILILQFIVSADSHARCVI